MCIRLGTAADFYAIREWLQVEYDKNEEGLWSNWNMSTVREMQRYPWWVICTAKAEDYPTGFCTTYNNNISLCSIMESEQRCGFGKDLIDHVLKQLDRTKDITLESTNDSWKFWQKFGFEFVNPWDEKDALKGFSEGGFKMILRAQ